MRIAQIATLATCVQPQGSGSVEGLVWLLARELTRLGHEVTVFAAAGSTTHGELVATLPGPYTRAGSPDDWQLCEWINLCRAVEASERFDVVHSHAYLWGIPLEPLSKAPMVHTLHISPDDDHVRLWSMAPHACVTALSHQQWQAFPHLSPVAVVYHGIDIGQFTFRSDPEDYVCYLGRFTSGKGPLQAIAVARALNLRLRLAGPANEYYRKHIAPHVDGRNVEYVGYVSGVEKDRLLGGARALLYPVQSPEPFGLVLVEAMLCGTPVVATRLGAVREIVEEGVSGYLADSPETFAQQVRKSFSLDRRRIRDQAAARFSADRMACEYVKVYQRLVAERRQS
jgi:glycosyltransferase involved in cell wall biosynthesis